MSDNQPPFEAPATVALLGADAPERVAAPVVRAVLDAIPEAVRRSQYGEYVNDKEAQKLTGLTARQLRYLREERRVGYHRVGRAVLYRTQELFEAIESGRIAARDEALPIRGRRAA